MTVMITAYDEDKTEGNLKPTNDKIDYMQQIINYTPDFNGTHKTTLNFTLTGKVSRYVCIFAVFTLFPFVSIKKSSMPLHSLNTEGVIDAVLMTFYLKMAHRKLFI